jgi:cob(I)alamin adenosyltransferase
MKIYTKTGDNGTTALFGGERVLKSDIRVEAYGTIDELNSFLGLLIEKVQAHDISVYLASIQHILFNIGSVVATVDEKYIAKLPALHSADIDSLEQSMDKMNETLPAMTNFILPGGGEAASLAHICRTVCRRAERNLVYLASVQEVRKEVEFSIIFLNRLSDYFFVLSRKLAQLNGKNEVIWKKDVTLLNLN